MIDLRPTPLQADLVTAARGAAAKEFPLAMGVEAALHGLEPFSEARWLRLAELGWFSLGLGLDDGGLGLGASEELRLAIELGRVAASGPIIATMLAAKGAARGGKRALGASLANGERKAGLLVGDMVVDAGEGDLALRTSAAGFEIVELLSTSRRVSVDPLTNLARVEEMSTILHVSGHSLLSELRLLVGGYLVGVAEAAIEMAASYAKAREQFGRPIGSFQAVKHRCAEMVIRAHPVKAQLMTGAYLLGHEGSGHAEINGGLLLAIAAARQNVDDNVQTHGGLGFTAEHPAGVLVKKVLSTRYLGGTTKELVADILSATPTRPV